MSHLDPIAYTYDADYHCPECAEKAHGRGKNGFIGTDSEDSEGNPIGVLAPWGEWMDVGYGNQTLACGTCGRVIEEYVEEICAQFNARFDAVKFIEWTEA